MSAIPSPLAGERHDATTEGRMVLALEMIADELRSIGEDLARFGATVGSDGNVGDGTLTESDRAGDRWENEGGHCQPEPAPVPEIKRTQVEHYAVGGYHYTNLADAISEAGRERARRARAGGLA